MTKSHAILTGPLVIALLAVAFCIWTAFGNDVNICVTTGCTLYADFSVFGISLWWIGAVAFALLCACALLGQAAIGRNLAGLFLLGDIGLLTLMALTAPCVSCLLIATLFALAYFMFRRRATDGKRQGAMPRSSVLLWIWLALFAVNLGQVARSQLDVWPILDESGEGNLRMFFSPTCKYCIEGVNALSGNINVAFYPLAENENDVAQIARMMALVDDGASMAEALVQSREESFTGIISAWSPEMILLRFRLLRNKAHVFAQGSQGVPFFERKGLPPGLIARSEKKTAPGHAPSLNPVTMNNGIAGGDPTLPVELQENTQCGGAAPCPPSQ